MKSSLPTWRDELGLWWRRHRGVFDRVCCRVGIVAALAWVFYLTVITLLK